jgi:hypothetical protein
MRLRPMRRRFASHLKEARQHSLITCCTHGILIPLTPASALRHRSTCFAYTTIDAEVGFRAHNWLVAAEVFNIADVKWNDIAHY